MIIGTFKTKGEKTVRVEIDTPSTINIDNEDWIHFGDDPLHISYDCENIDTHIIKSQATISFCSTHLITDELFDGPACRIFLEGSPIFVGVVSTKSFNQDYAQKWNYFEIVVDDYLFDLENHKYKDFIDWEEASLTADLTKISDIILNIIPSTNIFYDQSTVIVDGDNNEFDIFQDCYLHEHIFYGNDATDFMTNDEILEAILSYFNLSIRQVVENGQVRFYIWHAPKFNDETINFRRIDSPSLSTIIHFTQTPITQLHYKSDDTQISINEKYESFELEEELKVQEELFDNIFDESNFISPYYYMSPLYRIWHSSGDYDEGYGRMMIPKNITMRFYDHINDTVKESKDIVKYDANGLGIHGNWPFYEAFWKRAPIFAEVGTNNLREWNDYGYTREISKNLSLFFPCKAYTQTQNSTNVIWGDIQTAVAENDGMLEIHNITSKQLNPVLSNVTNYLVFDGNVRFSSTPYNSDVWYTNNGHDAYNKSLVQNGQLVELFNREGSNNTPDHIYNEAGPYYGWRPSPWLLVFFREEDELYRRYEGRKTHDFPLYNQIINFTDWNGVEYETNTSIVDFMTNNSDCGTAVERDGNPMKYYQNTSIQQQMGNVIYKVPVLICELKVGDKYCIEILDPSDNHKTKYVWMTEQECINAGITPLRRTFTIGIQPYSEDDLIDRSYDFYNNEIEDIILKNGQAIPITTADNLHGNVSFKIISPVQYFKPSQGSGGWIDRFWTYNTALPYCYRNASYWVRDNNSIDPSLYLTGIMITNLECNIASAMFTNSTEDAETTITYTNDISSAKKYDTIDMSICSGLTTDEYIKYNVTTAPAYNYVQYLGNDNLYHNVLSIKRNNVISKPENMYINDLYDQLSVTRKTVDVTLSKNFNLYTLPVFTWDTGHVYYPLGFEYDVKMENKTFTLYDSGLIQN